LQDRHRGTASAIEPNSFNDAPAEESPEAFEAIRGNASPTVRRKSQAKAMDILEKKLGWAAAQGATRPAARACQLKFDR
jgi:hypothetical protein